MADPFGSWSGTVQLLRSNTVGTTRLPPAVAGQSWANYAANANEPGGENSSAAATDWLAITLASGTLAYRVAY